MKSKKFRIVSSIFMTLIAIVLALSTACEATAPEAKTLKIGAIYILTGPGSETEIINKDGALLAMDWINENGGVTINGEKYLIDIILEDGKGTVDGWVAAATKLVQSDKVDFIIGGNRPDLIMAMQSVTEPAEVITSLGFGGGVPGLIDATKPYSFRPTPCGAEAFPIIYDYLFEAYPNVKTIAIIGEEGPGGEFFSYVSQMVAEAYGIEVVFMELYPVATEDLYPIWTKILAANPDAVDEGVGYIDQMSASLKQGRELGYTGPILSAGAGDMTVIRDMVGQEYADNYFTGSFEITAPDIPPTLKTIEELAADKLNTTFKSDFTLGWDSLWCLVQAIEEAQSLATTEIATTWENMTSIETAFGTGHMGGLETYGSKHLVLRPIPVTRLVNGKVETVKWAMPVVP